MTGFVLKIKCVTLTVQQHQTVQTLVDHVTLQSSKTPTNNEIIINNHVRIINALEQNIWIKKKQPWAPTRGSPAQFWITRDENKLVQRFMHKGHADPYRCIWSCLYTLREGQSCVFRPQCATRSCYSMWQVSWSLSKHLSHWISDWQKHTTVCQDVMARSQSCTWRGSVLQGHTPVPPGFPGKHGQRSSKRVQNELEP